jgi:hypothetical protein
MRTIHRATFHALASCGLVFGTALSAQNAAVQPNATTAQPPLFQGIVLDAKGKTVGALGAPAPQSNFSTVIRQISGILVQILIDPVVGFRPFNEFFTDPLVYMYQSSNCAGQAYLPVDGWNSGFPSLPTQGKTATILPATQPSIYFAGKPSVLTLGSYQTITGTPLDCVTLGPGFTQYVGLPQSVLVSSLGLTPPFSIK